MKKRNKFSESVTPFIDVAFILILFFSTSLVFAPEDYVDLDLPENNSNMKTLVEVEKEMIFNIKNNGDAYINDKIFAENDIPDSILFKRAYKIVSESKKIWFEKNGNIDDFYAVVRGDSAAYWGRALQIIQAVSKNGVQLSVALKPVENE